MREWIFFDFDGVIADTETLSLKSWQSLAIDPTSIKLEDIAGNTALENAKKLKNFLMPFSNINDIVIQKLHIEQELTRGGFPLIDGVKSVIAELVKLYRLAIVSSNSNENILRCLKQYDMLSYFEFICTPNHTLRNKPSADLYLEALRRSGVSRNFVVALEDSLSGWSAAQKADIRVIGFGENMRDQKNLTGYLDSFTDIRKVMGVFLSVFT